MEKRLMFASFPAFYAILRKAEVFAAGNFLKFGFGIFGRGYVLINEFFPMFVDKVNSRFTVAVDENGADEGFADVAQNVFIFADVFRTDNHVSVQVKVFSHGGNGFPTDQSDKARRQTAFRFFGKSPVEQGGNA